MANTIGVLSIDLIGNIGGFESSMRRAQTSAQRTAGTIDKQLSVSIRNTTAELTRLAGIAGVGFGAAQVIRYADSFTELQNRLRLVTKSQEELKGSTEGVYRIAQTTSQSMDSVGQVYQRIAQNADALGLSLSEVEGLTEKVAKAVAISGASAGSAQAGLQQFGQALASGVLRGDEFNSIMENIPGVAQAIATGLNVPIGALRQMAEDGKLTADVVINALGQAGEFIESKFGTRVKTVSQSLVELENAVGKFFGELNQGTGASGALVSILSGVAHNFDALALAGGTFASLKIGQALATAGIEARKLAIENAAAAGSYELESAAAAKSAASKRDIAAADLDRARASVLAAEAEFSAGAAEQATHVQRLADTQSLLVAERELEMQRLKSAATDAERVQASTRIAALRTSEAQITKQLAAAEAQRNTFSLYGSEKLKTALEAQGKATEILAASTLTAKRADQEATIAANAHAAARKGLSVAAGVANKALALAGGWPGVFALGLGAAAMAWSAFGKASVQAKDDTVESIASMNLSLDDLIAKFRELTKVQQDMLIDKYRDKFIESNEQMKSSLASLLDTFTPDASDGFATFYSDETTKAQQLLAQLTADTKLSSDERYEAGKKVIQSLQDQNIYGDETIQNMRRLWTETNSAATAASLYSDRTKELEVNVKSAATAMSSLEDAANAAAGASGKEWDTFIGKLEQTQTTLGMTADELARFEAQSLGAGYAQRELAANIAGVNTTYDTLVKAITDGDGKAIQGSKERIAQLIAEQAQLRANAAYAATYAAALAATGNAIDAMRAGSAESSKVFADEMKKGQELVKQVLANADRQAKAAIAMKSARSKGGGSKKTGKSDEEKEYEREQKQFKDWIKRQKEKIAFLGTESELEKINAELRLGNWSKTSKAQQEEMRQLAALVDLEEKRFEMLERSKELSGFNTFKDNAKDMEALADAFGRGVLSVDSYNRQLMRLGESNSIQTLKNGFGDASDMLNVSVGRMLDDFTTLKLGAAEAFGDLGSDALDGFSESVGRAIVYADDFGEAVGDLGKSLAADLIANLVKLGVQYLVFKVLGESMANEATTQSMALGAKTAAAWAPAAAAVSLATFGSNGIPAAAAIIGTNALSLGFAKIGFAEGGFTGQGNKYDAAGIVHAGEYVFNAQRVREIGLDNLRRLDQMGGWADGGYVANSPVNSAVSSLSSGASTGEITVNTYTSKGLDVKQGRDANGNRVIEIRETLDAVAAAFSNPNSNISRSLNKNFKTKRTF